MNVLVVAPHPDDEALGCGGVLRLHADAGNCVSVVFLTSGERGATDLALAEAGAAREREAEEAAAILGVTCLRFLRQPDWWLGDHVEEATRLLAGEVERAGPDLIYVPHGNEWHPDHRVAHRIGAALPAVAGNGTALRTYEVWTPMATFDDVRDTSSVMARKLEAVRAYKSQLREFRFDRAIEGLNRFRGALATRTEYAEVFGCPPVPVPASAFVSNRTNT